MFDVAMNTAAQHLPRLSASEFGLWFRHKGAHGFEGAPETELILESMTRIDEMLLPLFANRQSEANPTHTMQLLRDLREQAKSISYHQIGRASCRERG